MNNLRFFLTAAAFSLAACSADSISPAAESASETALAAKGPKPTALPTFLTTSGTGIANPSISFWAKRGQRSEVYMYYAPEPGEADGRVFLRFRVDRGSLLRYPDGRSFAAGDSVLITISVSDPVHQVVNFQPAGLVFAPNDPADIKISYLETDPDWNYDGSVNAKDDRLQSRFAIWQQHGANPWVKLTSVVVTSSHEVEADIPGFTSYAVAY